MTRLSIASLALLLASCGARGVPARPAASQRGAPAASATSPTSDLDTDAIVAAVTKVRGLAPKRPIEFRFVDDEELASRVIAGGKDPVTATYALAAYDTERKVVLLRKESPAWLGGQSMRGVVAHEVTHALQDQYFDMAKLKADEPDVSRARLALLEGDAEATAAGADAILSGLPPKRAIMRRAASGDDDGSRHLVTDGHVDPRAEQLPPYERDVLLFPYVRGASFVGAIVRTGGFALVDEAFRKPPSSTAEILHPEAYLQGRVRREVADLELPPGMSATAAQGAIGELGLRVLLADNDISVRETNELAMVWRGDRFVQVTTSSGSRASLGAIVCADEDAAKRLEARLKALGMNEHRAGHVVGVVVGVTGPKVISWAQKMARASVAKVALSPPLAVRQLAPPAPAESLGAIALAGNVQGDAYHNPSLGLAMTVPPGLTLATPARTPELVDVFGGDGRAFGLTIFEGRHTEASIRALEDAMLSGFKRHGEPDSKDHAAVSTGYGKADELRAAFPATGARVRIAAVPICKAEATLLVAAMDSKDGSPLGAAMNQFLERLNPSATDSSPYCRAVIEAHTTDLP